MNKLLPFATACSLLSPAAAFAAHPLVSDDTGTQDDNNWQYEFNVEETSREPDTGRQRLWNTTLTRGFGDAVDLYVNAPYIHVQTRSDDYGSGLGDIELGAKWRWLDRGPFTLAVKPHLGIPTGNDRRGLGSGRVNVGATLLAQYDIAQFTFIANAGLAYQPNRHGDLTSLWQMSGAMLYRVTDQLQFAVDVGTERNPDRDAHANPAFAIAGAIYSPRRWLDLDLGYRRGLNDQAYDHSVLAGITARW